MNLFKRVAWATVAAQHVKSKLPLGASNLEGPTKLNQGLAQEAVDTANRYLNDFVIRLRQQEQQITKRRALHLYKLTGMGTGGGNCMWQAAAAFLYLSKHNVAPRAVVSVPMNRNGDHYFVAIGLPDEPSRYISNWDAKEVVICDPWLAEQQAVLGTLREVYGVYSPDAYVTALEKADVIEKDKDERTVYYEER